MDMLVSTEWLAGELGAPDLRVVDATYFLPGGGDAAALYEALLAHAQAAGLPRLTVHASEYSRRFLARRGWVLDRVEGLTPDSGVRYDRNHMSIDLTGETA